MNVPGQVIESENMYSNKRNRQGKKFFLAYFAVIAILFLWNLFHCTGISWESRETYLQSVTDETSIKPEDGDVLSAIEIKDGNTVILKTHSGEEFKPGKKSRLRGIELLGYENRNSLRLTDETISAEVYSSGDHEKLLSGSYLLCNQTLYPTDETNMYIAFSDRAAADKGQGELEIRIRTQGLTRNGIFFTGRGLESNEGGVTDKMPALLYYEKKIWNPLMSILYFIVEALLGIGCLILFNTKKVPLTNRGEAVEKYRERQESTGKSGNSIRLSSGKKNIRRMICPICLLLVLLLYLGMTYVQAIKENVGASSYDILVPSPRNKEEVKLSSGQSLRQTFVSGEDHLSGIGIMIGKENEDDPDSSSGKTELRWKILDEKGEAVLSEGSGNLSELDRADTLLTKDKQDEDTLKLTGKYRVLPLKTFLEKTRGNRFTLELAVSGQKTDSGNTIAIEATTESNGTLTGPDGSEEPVEICMLGLYQNNRFLKGMFVWVCAMLLIMLTGLYAAARFFSDRTAVMYCLCALCMGIMFSFMTPAYSISDERTHIDTIYILSNKLTGIQDEPGPNRAWKRACDVDPTLANTMPLNIDRYRPAAENLFGKAGKMSGGSKGSKEGSGEDQEEKISDSRELVSVYTRNAITNGTVLCYLPSAIGFTLARLLGRNMITMVMAARWVNLLACICIMYFAVRRMPYGAACMAVLGLLPKTLQQTASCSYDGMIISVTYLFIAYCLGVICEEQYSVADIVVLFMSGWFVASSKGGAYLPVLGMLFMIPLVRSRGRMMTDREGKLWLRISAGALVSAFILFSGKYVARLIGMVSRPSGETYSRTGTKALYTLGDFIHAPFQLVKIYLNTLNARGDGLLGELVGKNLCQKWIFVYAFLFLAMLGMLHGTESRFNKGKKMADAIGLAGKTWMFLLMLVSVAMIFMSMLLAFTTKDAAFIEGLQGRYFLPTAPLLYLSLENKRLQRTKVPDSSILYAVVFLLALTICEILRVYLG